MLRLLAAVFLTACAAQVPRDGFYGMSETRIASELKAIHASHPSLAGRVEEVSRRFLGTPYKLGPLGEGSSGRFDRLPLYSFQAVDCTTFVEEVMALSLDADLHHALTVTLQRIRYKDGRIGYQSRNHFPESDWLPNNIAAGYLQDITRDVAGPLTRLATKRISKRAWYLAKTTADLEGFSGATAAEKQQALARWRALASHYTDQVSTLPYVPVADLPGVLAKIPSGTIANLVRADLPDKPVMISHQLFIIQEGGAAYVRQASYGRFVEDIPALDYFRRYAHSSWPLLGVNLDAIRSP